MIEERGPFRPLAALAVAVATIAPFPLYYSLTCNPGRLGLLYVLLGLMVVGLFGAGIVFAGRGRLRYALLFTVALVPCALAAGFVAFWFSFGRCFTF